MAACTCDSPGPFLIPSTVAIPGQLKTAAQLPQLLLNCVRPWMQAGALPSLGSLALNNIGVTGPLPPSWGKNFSLPSLQQLSLNDNPIKGDLCPLLLCTNRSLRLLHSMRSQPGQQMTNASWILVCVARNIHQSIWHQKRGQGTRPARS